MKVIISILTFITIFELDIYAQSIADTIIKPRTESSIMLDSVLYLDPAPTYEQYIVLLSKVAQLSKSEKDWNTYTGSQLALSTCYNMIDQLTNELKCLSEAYHYSTSKDDIDPVYKSVAINNMAQNESNKGNNTKAIELFLDGIAFELEHRNDPLSIGISYKNVSARYRVLGDYQNALNYAKNGLSNILEMPSDKFDSYSKRDLYRALGYEMVGLSQQSLKDYKGAFNSFKIGIEEIRSSSLSKDKEVYKKWVDINLRFIDLFLVQDDTINAQLYFDQLSKRDNKYADYRAYMKAEYSGILLFKKKQYTNAKTNLLNALELGEKQFENNRQFPAVPRLFMNLGDLYQEIDSSETAFQYYQKGLKWYDESIGMNLKDNPEVKNIAGAPQAIEIIRKKALLAYNLYKESDQKDYLDIAVDGYKATINLIDKLKVDALDSGSKFFVAEEVKPIYDEALMVLYENYQLNKSDSLLNSIFQIMENNKSAILFEVVQSRSQMLSSAIPEDEISKIQEYKRNVAFYSEKKGIELAKTEPDKTILDQFEDEIFSNKQNLLLMEQRISEMYPDYFDFRTNLFNLISIEKIQERLGEKEILIEYFEGDNNLYIFSISRTGSNVRRVPKKDIIEKAQSFRSLVTTPSEEIYSSNVPLELTKQLIQSEMDLFKSPNQFIIIPDGVLSYISFEALKNENNEFLINDASFSYLYSVKQWKETTSEFLPSEAKMLAVAPSFDSETLEQNSCMDSPLAPLLYSEEEVTFLENNFDGKFVKLSNYSVETFKNEISNFDMLHLATHACVNSSDIMLSEIHFSDGFITIYDLQALEINPKLQILGACNSGTGKLSVGEGVISISRGFIEAGVESIQSGMWTLDDFSTSKITQGMYLYLKEGNSKSNALRQAKLDFINSSDRLRKHPYYWAGMVSVGDNSPLFKMTILGNYFYWLIGVLSIVLLVILFGFKGRKSKTI